ncbi:hypothetical protein [Haladaptatus sp. CMSO5]|uniref:hypothetical protein n=1 Tax=Haladaptatus sp. CMSO5 TaxID=3120514 RepID=UPI002FCE16F3
MTDVSTSRATSIGWGQVSNAIWGPPPKDEHTLSAGDEARLDELAASLHANGGAEGTTATSLLAFGTNAIGGVGALFAGSVADRVGQTTVTSACMVSSGLSCLAAGFVFGEPLVILAPFCLVWGFVIVADSAQFSACVSELAEDNYVGTALTLQTAIGYIITTVSIQLVPVFEGYLGWQWAFAPLAMGPAIGTAAMLYLRVLPEASNLAGGRG